MHLIKSILNISLLAFQYALLPIVLYQSVVSIFGWFKRKEVPAERFPAVNRFAVLVAAHNEERVIGNIVRNLKSLNYTKEMYDIFVIADNCSDNTAGIAQRNGAIVFERFDSVKKGKGFALEWMFAKLFKMDKKYDAVCILDADNLVSSNFLMEMNSHLCRGHKVIQGYLDSKNPYDSLISGSYSIAYWLSNRLFQLPRYYLGLCCSIGGTGFVVSTQVLKEIGWGATSLTEDLEFTVKLVLKGMKVYWSHEAVIYDEKPLNITQSWRQRKRWMQGHSDCACRYLAKLLNKAFKDMDMVSFDYALYLIQPLIIVINGVILFMNMAKFLLFTDFSRMLNTNLLGSAVLMFVITYISFIFVVAEGKHSWGIIKHFLFFPFFNLTWIPIIIQGFIDRNKREWVHTLHTRSMDISDIESLEKVG